VRSTTVAKRARLAAEWHPTKNGALTPRDVAADGFRKVWWRCPAGFDHVWRATPHSRSQGAKCPFCANRRVSATNSLAARRPDLAAQWHPFKNRPLRPTDLVAGSSRKVWWRCPRSPAHAWQALVLERSGPRAAGCPFCLGRRVAPDNSLERRRPDVASLWHPTKNGTLTPRDVTPGVRRIVWWRCPHGDDHEWRAAVCDRKSYSCPFCARRKASKAESLAATHRRIAREWHPTENGALTPRDVVPGSRRRVWWRCARDASHVWQALVADRSRGSTCPYCRGRLFRRGAAGSLLGEAPAVAREWHPTDNGDLTPADVSIKSRRPVWWKCPAGPDHVWQSSPVHRGARGQGCPFCAGKRASVTNAIATVRPDWAAEWHPTENGALTPRDLTPGAHRLVVWQCTKNRRHVWSAAPHARRGCPFCAGRRPAPGPAARAR
jgi:hypothetical protein